MILELSPGERHRIAGLFAGKEDTMIRSVLQGEMGRAFVNTVSAPESAKLICGDFCFFGGRPEQELAGYLPADFPRNRALLAPEPEEWLPLLERAAGKKLHPFPRYAIRKDTVFDRLTLARILRSPLPAGYSLQRFDLPLVRQALSQGWSRDFCSCFRDPYDYLRRGIGYGILYRGELTAGASSYTVYREGIEIEIDTHREHRRRGLAEHCAAALILACIDRDLYPSWDAANLVSVHLAQKLGYQLAGEYDTYLLEQ